MRRLRALAVLLLCFAGCGVGTYRTAQVRGQMEMRLVATEGGEELPRWFSDERLRLERGAFVDGSLVREVQLEDMPDDTRHIVLVLDETGTERLAAVTREHRGRRLAIVVDGRVVVAPTITTVIADGVAHVTVDGDIEQVYSALTREPAD